MASILLSPLSHRSRGAAAAMAVAVAGAGVGVTLVGSLTDRPPVIMGGAVVLALAFVVLFRTTRGFETEHEDSVRLDAILTHAPSSFLLMDRDRRILTASSNFNAVTGRSLADMAGRHCTRNLWFDGFCQGCPSQKAIDSGIPETEVVSVEERDGRVRFFEHTAVPVHRGGKLDGVLEAVTDVTERRLLQDNVVRAEKLASVGEMASVVSHEMRNALTSVKMILQLMGEDSKSDKEAVSVALDSIAHSEAVMQELLDFARPAPPNPVPLDVLAFLEECVRFVGPQARRVGADLRVEVPGPLRGIRADAERLRSAVVNLLLNACQASTAGGRILVRAREFHLPRELRDVCGTCGAVVEPLEPAGVSESSTAAVSTVREVLLPAGTDVLALEVEDDGPGIPPDRLIRVFDPFYTTKVNGTGLGLSLVKQVANDHGGLAIAENLDHGCQMTIVLPISDPSHSE